MHCKYCNLPIYPPGVSYTGTACFFNGNHPEMFTKSGGNTDWQRLESKIDRILEFLASKPKNGDTND